MHLDIGSLLQPDPSDPNWRLPVPRVVHPASLSDLLPSIVDFQKALLPRSRSVISQLNRLLLAEPAIPPSALTQAQKLWGSVALAVDRGVLSLGGFDIASETIEFLTVRFGHQAVPVTTALRLCPPSTIDGVIDDTHVGWLYLIGCLEPIRRGFRPFSDVDVSGLPVEVTEESARHWLSSLVPPGIADEIRALLEVTQALQPKGAMFPNPVFGGIGPIAGSDGDWIVGDTLVELKCTVRGISREHVAQLVCYAALSRLPDSSAEMPFFDRLALMLPRQSSIVTGTIEQWLGAFGAPPSMSTLTAITDYFASMATAA